jgi:hypothetical protein
VYGRGVGRSKQGAEQEAARMAIEALQNELSRNDHAALIALRGRVDKNGTSPDRKDDEPKPA